MRTRTQLPKYRLNPGDRFGKLELLGYHGGHKWHCRCDCGEQVAVRTHQMVNGRATSCGCHQRVANFKHGLSRSREYRAWIDIKSRCLNPDHAEYHWYGGRDITIAPEWRDSFEAFFAEVGHRPAGHSIDRIDNARGYEPGNCRWATPAEQNRNIRRNRWYTHDGKTMVLPDWSKETGLNLSTLHARLRRGLTFEEAITVRP